ncbi:DUF4124 domain-containing protein [uncultured Thiohalocapsa sp.]|uniref:DUF4124 domain-containing protein n=1 Tax=uncultured Thiohalocapsa sp. TaxID=768990 RepID=UPI0025EA14AD|nr:DUF4124 domain-containing protein [uncultured Thiohalocapsa sp.]
MWLRSCSTALLLCCFGAPLAAGMHKCVDADGNVTYSQTACQAPPGATPRRVSAAAEAAADGSGAAQGDVLCERVRAFALELAVAMRQGVGLDRTVAVLGGRADPAGVTARYGSSAGTGSRRIIGDDALEIINHVFAFAGRGAVEPASIADSAAQQCLRGRFEFERGAPGGADGLRRSAGSGILLNPQGMVLTADRLIAECRGLRAYRDGAWQDARVLRRAPALDLAVLVADGLHGRPAVLTDADGVEAQRLFAASLPLRGVLTGEVSVMDVAPSDAAAGDGAGRGSASAPAGRQGAATSGLPVPESALPISLPDGPARLGAPLIGSGGLVAGVTVAGADAGTFAAVPAPVLRRFLADAGVAFYSAAALGRLTLEEVRRRAAGFTVHLECMP